MCLFDLIILMIACHRRMNIKMIQQPQAIARILRCDQVDLLQNPSTRIVISSRLPIGVAHRYSFPLSSLMKFSLFFLYKFSLSILGTSELYNL